MFGARAVMVAVGLALAGTISASAQISRGAGTRCMNSTVRVRIVDARNEHPVRGGIRVQLMTTLGGATAESTHIPNDDGLVEFSAPSRANYRIRVQFEDGSDTVSDDFMIPCNETDHFETVRVKPPSAPSQLAPPGSQTVSANSYNIPEKARKEFEKGAAALTSNDLPNARKHLEKALEIYPKYGLAQNDLGVAYMKSGDKVQGRAAFQKAMELEPMLFSPHMNLGRLALADNQMDAAESQFAQATRLDPKDPEACMLLAATQLEQGKAREAADNARRVHALGDEKFTVAHMMAARALRILGQGDEAIKQYEAFLRETPASALTEHAQKELDHLRARLVAPVDPLAPPPAPAPPKQ